MVSGWIFGSSSKYQDWISMAFFLVDLAGVILTSVTDSLWDFSWLTKHALVEQRVALCDYRQVIA